MIVQRIRVLVVEDNLLITLNLELSLRDAGHDVVGPATTSADATSIAERTRPDLALVDIRLLDGPTGASLSRELFARFGIPSLFVSSEFHEAYNNKDAALGLILKPYRPDTILKSVEVAKALMSGDPLPERLPAGLELFR